VWRYKVGSIPVIFGVEIALLVLVGAHVGSTAGAGVFGRLAGVGAVRNAAAANAPENGH